MKKYFGVFITLLSAMLLCVLPAKACSAYSPEAAVDFARNHCASNHTEHHNNCKDCNALLSYGSVIPKTEHIWNTGVITLSPTTSSTGIKTYTCINCGATKEETIEKLAEPSTPPDKDNGGNNDKNLSLYFKNIGTQYICFYQIILS